MPFVQMENISHFLRACQAPPLNLQPHDVFLTVDLFEQKDPAQVLQCISAFSRVANKVQPSKFPSVIGPKARGGVVSPQGTGGLVGGGSYGNRTRGASIASNTTSAYNPGGRVTPNKTGDNVSGRWSPTKQDRLQLSPRPGSTTSWSNKKDEGATAPAWNIAQYGYMGGASQGSMGVSFGGRRQITSAGPHVPSLAEKEKKRREQEAEEERMRLAAEEARRREQEAEEERGRQEEEERWAEEERKLKAKAAEEKKKWEEDERRGKEEEERRKKEEAEAEAEARRAKERLAARNTSDSRLQGQFLSQYQAEQGRNDKSTSPGPSARIAELEKELEEARKREAEYQREREERRKARGHQTTENLDLQNRIKDRSRSRPRARRDSEESWIPDEREYLRREWKKQHPGEELTPQSRPAHTSEELAPPPPPRPTQHAELPPPMPPRQPSQYKDMEPAVSRPLPVPTPSERLEPVKLVSNTTGPSSRPLPNPKAYKSPPQKQAAPAPLPSVDGAGAAPAPQSRTDRFLSSNPAPKQEQPKTTYSSEIGNFDSTAERDAEDRRRMASQTKTKAGGWASKSLLEREMENERQRQKEWEEGQKATAAAAKNVPKDGGVDGIGGGIGGRWDVNQWTGYTGGDGQNKGNQGIGAGRRQIVGPRPPPAGR